MQINSHNYRVSTVISSLSKQNTDLWPCF